MQKMNSTSRSGSAKLVVIAVVAALAGAGFLAYKVFATPESPPESGRATAEPFLEAIRKGEGAAAWETTTTAFKSETGRENFLKYVEEHPIVKEPLEFYNFQTVTMNGLACNLVEFGKEGAPAKSLKVRVVVAKEYGKWKVERLIADEPKK
jgi:hypothetical protein